MLPILSALAPVFIITAIGYVLVNTKIAGAEVWDALDHITFYLLFPALLAKTLIRANLGAVPAANFVMVSLGAITIMAACLLLAFSVFRHRVSGPAFTSIFQGAVRFQSTVAVAISAALFGEQGLTFAALSVASLVPLAQLYTVLVLIIFGDGNVKAKPLFIIQRLVMNPLTLACVAGLVLNRTGVPNFVYETLNLLGTASIGLTLLAVGAGLNLAKATEARGVVAGSIVIRLIAMPLLVFGLCWLVGLSGLGRTIAIIAGGVPTAATAYTMARKMGGDAELMAQIITFQSVASAVTLPFLIYVAEHP